MKAPLTTTCPTPSRTRFALTLNGQYLVANHSYHGSPWHTTSCPSEATLIVDQDVAAARARAIGPAVSICFVSLAP